MQKKILVIGLTLGVMLSLTGCGAMQKSDDTENTKQLTNADTASVVENNDAAANNTDEAAATGGYSQAELDAKFKSTQDAQKSVDEAGQVDEQIISAQKNVDTSGL